MGGQRKKWVPPQPLQKWGGTENCPPRPSKMEGQKYRCPPHSTSQMGVQKIEQNRVPPSDPSNGGAHDHFCPSIFERWGGAHDHFCPPHGVEMEGQKRSISSLRQFCQNWRKNASFDRLPLHNGRAIHTIAPPFWRECSPKIILPLHTFGGALLRSSAPPYGGAILQLPPPNPSENGG